MDISILKNWWKLNNVCSSHQWSQQKPEIEMGISQQRHCQFELKGNRESGTDEERLLDFLDSGGPDHRAIQLWMCVILQAKGRMTLKALQRSQGCPPTTGPGARLFPPWFQRAGRALAESLEGGTSATENHSWSNGVLLARVSALLFYQVQND